MLNIIISSATRTKLTIKHGGVSELEIEQCFENMAGRFLQDDREDHQTDPPTRWFVAETNKRRNLKICFVLKGVNVHIKTAYEPDEAEIDLYERKGK